MISEADKTDEKTPPVLRLDVTPPPKGAPTPLPARVSTRPPPGRPPGAVSMSELIARITADVRDVAMLELDRKTSELQARLTTEVKTASTVAVAALSLTAAALALMGFSRVARETRLGVAFLALASLAVGAVFTGARRGRTTPRS